MPDNTRWLAVPAAFWLLLVVVLDLRWLPAAIEVVRLRRVVPAMTPILVLAVALAPAPAAASDARVEAPPERAYSAFSADPARRFDFWVGTWDVNLRMLEDDLTFEDAVAAHASIYPILGGKAILELWDSTPIKGLSLRYYDPVAKRWDLWLDWPRPNTSRLSRLTGGFRHGRAEFRGTAPRPDGGTSTTLFTFGDITPFSLRWDDLHSSDGGKTWTRNWIMEFTRTAVDPPWPLRPGSVPTYHDGGRCDDPRFRGYELLAGSWRGDRTRVDFFPILDGCAVIGFLEDGAGRDEFLLLTFDTFAGRWVTAVLDDAPGTGLVVYEGENTWVSLASDGDGGLSWWVWGKPRIVNGPGDHLGYRRGDRELTFERVEGGPRDPS